MQIITAAIDIETTGLSPQWHDIIEIAIQPLDVDFSLSSAIPPFIARIRARRPQNAHPKAMEINGLDLNGGEEYSDVLKRLGAWLAEYGIERISILGHNVDFDRAFIEAQMPELAAKMGHRDIRDSQRLARAFNDLVIMKTGKPAFENLGLVALREALGIEGSQAHRALDDAVDSAKVYKVLLEWMDVAWEQNKERQQ